MNELEYRLCNISMPIRAGMADMITLFSLKENPDIEDIWIPPQKRPVIYVNPTFVGRYCKTDEHLFIFVLSEVYRLRLCQTSSFQGEYKEAEVAARAMIHAFLCSIFPEEEYTSFFTQFYEEDIFPECLLRPPSNYPGPPQYPPNLKREIVEIWNHLYYGSDLEYAELIEKISVIISAYRMAGNYYFPDLIGGNYCKKETQIDPKKHFIFLQIISHIAIDPSFIPKGGGRSLLALEAEYKLKLNPAKRPNKTLERAIYLAARTTASSTVHKKTHKKVEILQAWPSRDRKAFAVSAGGSPSLLYRNETLFSEYRPQVVDIYFDVSGSMEHFLVYCAEAILSCSRKININLWLFSVGIVPLSIEDLSSGEIPTYGGTSINEVTEHILSIKATSVVIITDGYVGEVPEEHFEYCKRHVNVQVVYTPDYSSDDLDPITNKKHVFAGQYKKVEAS